MTAFRLSTYREAQPVSLTLGLPVTVTWRYSDTEIAGLDEDGLALEYLMESGAWEPVFSPAEQRWPDENRLQTAIQELGEYVFGQPFRHYLPLAVNDF